MTASWPAELPQRWLIQGNDQQLGENRLQSQTDVGPGKSRPRQSLVSDTFTGAMRMSSAQWLALLEFGETTLGKWVLPFEVPATDEGETWLVLFKGKPRRNNIGGDRWTVMMTLEILP